VSRAGLEPATR